MNMLEKLPEITEEALGGLTADESLKSRILKKASASPGAEKRSFLRPAVALVSAAALMVGALLALNGRDAVPSPEETPVLRSFPAGAVSDPGILPADVDAFGAESIETAAHGKVTETQALEELLKALASAGKAETPADSPAEDELVLRCKNGTVYRWSLHEPYLSSGDGTWSCPAFFRLLGE